MHGREVCNAFSELNDPDDQASRFRAQLEKKERGEEETMDYDDDYVRALEYGMPPAAGLRNGWWTGLVMCAHERRVDSTSSSSRSCGPRRASIRQARAP